MIFSIFLRNFKIYRGWNYVPISTGDYFTAFIGDNGVGKSSILEALDTFFNRPMSEWNYNHSILKSGFDREPNICPIFIVEKAKINKNRNVYKYLSTISDIMWQIEEGDAHNTHKHIVAQLVKQINALKLHNSRCDDEYFLFPCGFKKISSSNTELTLGVFDSIQSFSDDLFNEHNVDLSSVLDEIYSYVKDEFEYIYTPSEIDYDTYTKIEGKTIQSLMGTSVDLIIKDCIDEGVIKDINSGLDEFLRKVEVYLEKYEYKKPAKRQTLFNLTHLTSKIIETYFESKVLNLRSNSELTPIYNFSSGEKRKAIIDLARAFILNSGRDLHNKTVVIAMDEPEVSLHTSACFEQFEKLEEISKNRVQTLISTHWYGFFPSVSSGNAVYIADSEDNRVSFLINLSRFREDVRLIRNETQGKMPSNIELKSVNDFVQSVISSITRSNKRWIICEGASDKIYLNHFLEGEGFNILSVGGSKYVKKVYEYIYLALEDERSDIKGKVYFLLDTDKKFEGYSSKDSMKNLRLRRMQINSVSKAVELLKASDNSHFPPTEIENVLNSEIFKEVLEYYCATGHKGLLENVVDSCLGFENELVSGVAFDFRISELASLDEFFDQIGMKVKFAKKYCELDVHRKVPNWVNDIKDFFLD
ncbi:AAA family ATPase [Shewanella xiamenensis]|uniref:AAA family ATPase n=1 Tax=Shewanella xiamenensis TaxID=332186 RepID=UPI0035BABF07